MLARGEWRPTRDVEKHGPARADTIGFHLPGLYSPLGWKSWSSCVGEFLEAKPDPFKLKTFVNTVLAETFEEEGDSVELDHLKTRREQWDAEVPEGAGALVCSVDTQADRLEALVVAYGHGEEAWLIAHAQFFGSPGRTSEGKEADVWRELDSWCRRRWEHASGQKLGLDCVVVDSGGLHTDEVYRWCATRRNAFLGNEGVRTKVFAIKGGSEIGKPLVSPPTRTNRYGVKLYVLGVSAGKDMVLARLGIAKRGPGCVHLRADVADDDFLEQLTCERAVRKYVKGKGSVREWVKPDGKRNEAFDLSVYALSALYIMGAALIVKLKKRAEQWRVPPQAPDDSGSAPAPLAPVPRLPRRGFAQRW
jgi:phage terminase large subunit GpA-like protein